MLGVLMPFRNAHEYVSQAISSILSQSYSEFRLVLVDDRSDERTSRAVARFQDKRIVIVRSEGAGVAAALNTGLRHCQGCLLVARHDADDVSHPDRFRRQISYMSEHPDTVVLATQAARIDAGGAYLGPFQTPFSPQKMHKALTLGNPICHGSVMFRTREVVAAGGYDPAFDVAQDYELWVRLARRHNFAAHPSTLYQYRVHENSWSHRDPNYYAAVVSRIVETAQVLLEEK